MCVCDTLTHIEPCCRQNYFIGLIGDDGYKETYSE